MSSVSAQILVTGAAGFIGSHVADALLARGDHVVGLDNLNDYYDPARKRANVEEIVAHAPRKELFEFVHADIRDRAALDTLFSRCQFSGIVHLAAMAGVRASVADPWLYYDVNVTGTLNLLDAARRFGLPHFVFASTSSVYGDTPRIPFVETDPADKPLAPYPASKRAAELVGHAYHHLYGMHFTALRFFTVYGPRGRPDMMAYKVMDSLSLGREVPLYEGGQMHRDWTFVSDIVAGILGAVDRPLGYEVCNLGRGQPVLLASFVEEIEKLAGAKARLNSEPMSSADIKYTFADISKAARLLGYAPTVSVPEGVERFWRWYHTAVVPRRD